MEVALGWSGVFPTPKKGARMRGVVATQNSSIILFVHHAGAVAVTIKYLLILFDILEFMAARFNRK